MSSKIVGIDARFYGPLSKGLGRYVQEIVDNIIKISLANNDDIKYVIFLSSENYDYFEANNDNVKKIQLNFKWYSLREQILFPFYIWKEKINLMHFPHFNVPIFTPSKFVVTIHDLILTHFPTQRATTLNPLLYKLKNLAYRIVIHFAVKRSKKIITVSNFTKDDILSQFKVDKDKIKVIYEGVSSLSFNKDNLFSSKLSIEEVLKKYNINNKYFLYVGNAYPHKNLEKLIKVFSIFYHQHPDTSLVLVGKNDYFYDRIKQYAKSLNMWQEENLNNPIIFTNYVSDSCLDVLYKNSLVYIFPSLYEGFGLPPVEAIARGCLVLSSDRASLPEILGAGAIYFNPEDDNDILKKMDIAISHQELKEKVIRDGQKEIEKYNWWECSNKTLNVYKECL